MTGSHDTRRIAGERSYRNRYSDTHQGVLENPSRIDTLGTLGEQAFALYFGIPVATIARKGPVSCNFVLEDGTRVDVCASDAREARLIVTPKDVQSGTIDAFILVELRKRKHLPLSVEHAHLRGWATPAMLAAVTPEKISARKGATPVHALYRSQLLPIEDLLKRHQPHMRSLFDS